MKILDRTKNMNPNNNKNIENINNLNNNINNNKLKI